MAADHGPLRLLESSRYSSPVDATVCVRVCMCVNEAHLYCSYLLLTVGQMNNEFAKILYWYIGRSPTCFFQFQLWPSMFGRRRKGSPQRVLEGPQRAHVLILVPMNQFSSVHLLSCVQLFATPWIAARQASLSITYSWRSLKLMSNESVMPSSHLILCRPLLLLPPIPPSIRIFSNESTLCMRWPKYWSFSFCISPSKEHPGMISSRMDWLDLLAVQGTLKSLLQHHSSNASILRCSAFFIVQFSHPCMTTGKTIALTRWTFVGKVMSLLLNMLSRLVIIFLPRSKRLLISWLQSQSAVILEPKKIKSDTVSTVSPSISHEVMGPDAMIWS